jgi:hypothetical protein
MYYRGYLLSICNSGPPACDLRTADVLFDAPCARTVLLLSFQPIAPSTTRLVRGSDGTSP